MATSLTIDGATVEAVEALEGAGVRTLLLKGPALAALLYDAGEERIWDDADLLVAPDDRDRALEVLGSLGFRPRISDPLERGSVPHAVHLIRPAERAFVGAPAADSIDLHRSFAGVASGDERFWESVSAGTDSIELFAREIEVPSVPARLALVALHAASHGAGHERSARDLERAVERFGEAEWSAAARLARDWLALDYFVVGVGLAPDGPALLGRLGISHNPSRPARMRGAGMPRAQRSLEQLGRTEGFGPRVRLIARKLFPSPEVMRTWQPLARRGRGGLALAYLWRPPWLLFQLGPALLAWLKAALR